MIVGKRRRDAAPRRPIKKARLDEKRFVDVLNRVLLLSDRGGERLDPDGAAGEFVDQSEQQHRIHLVEAHRIDFEHSQRFFGDFLRYPSVGLYLRVVAHAAEQAVGDAWSTARAAGGRGARSASAAARARATTD